LKLRALLTPLLTLFVAACGNSSPVGGLPASSSFQSSPKTQAARFLTQATFGPTLEEIEALGASGDYEGWLAQQRAAPVSLELPYLQQQNRVLSQGDRVEAWWRVAIEGPDQLRQRVAFALSEIMVVSEQSILWETPEGLAYYYDVLAKNALGNFRQLLDEVTLTPEMGRFLSMFRNQKPNREAGIRADENYAREVMQLFTIGLVQLNLDGTPRLDAEGKAIPTFNQSDIANLARVFTGWSWAGGNSDDDFDSPIPHWIEPMRAYESYHDRDAKVILDNTPVPAGQNAREELTSALDTIFQHPNVGPFIGKQLIQRLVTSNPSPAYVQRVAGIFDDNGSGERGDLFAVTRAILLDPEARAAPTAEFGKLREPLLKASHLWRAFAARGNNGRYDYQTPMDEFSEGPLQAATVFNFFRPEFRPVGVLSRAGLVAPEFQITNEATIARVSNQMRRFSAHYRSSQSTTSTEPQQILLDLAPWEARAADPARLLDDLNLVLMSGQMPGAMRNTLLTFIREIPAEEPAARVAEAVHLIVTSPQYAVQQ
jgi:uncharacterized protein (DUF1800 family)